MAQPSAFLALPGEIRNAIVDYVFWREPGTAPPPLKASPLALALTCRQLRAEYQTLARSVTAFKISWVSAIELQTKTSSVPSEVISSVKTLQIYLPAKLEDLYVDSSRRLRVKGFALLAAGFTGLEELYIRYRPEHNISDVGLLGRETLMLVVWNLLWEKGRSRLQKICAIHDGAQPYLCATLLHAVFTNFGPARRSKRWKMLRDWERGELYFAMCREGQAPRRVTLTMGYSFREAEEYSTIRELLLNVSLIPGLHRLTRDGEIC